MTHSTTHIRWNYGQQFLHWIMALVILVMMVAGWIAKTLPISPLKSEIFFWHKSFGILLFGLVFIRIVWRLLHTTPRLPDTMARWEQVTAHTTHLMLYFMMVITPFSGWLINSAGKFPFKVFGVWSLPALVGPDKEIQNFAQWVHLGCFSLFSILLILHIGASLHHHWVAKDDVLRRMLPQGNSNQSSGMRGTP